MTFHHVKHLKCNNNVQGQYEVIIKGVDNNSGIELITTVFPRSAKGQR